MNGQTEVVDILAGMALFADLTAAQLQEIAHTFEEELFEEGNRVIRQGIGGGGFYVILDGEASVEVGGRTIGRFARGDFFGEISILLGETPTADIVARTSLHCLVLPGGSLGSFLLSHPSVAVRMLAAEARRLRNTTRWLS